MNVWLLKNVMEGIMNEIYVCLSFCFFPIFQLVFRFCVCVCVLCRFSAKPFKDLWLTKYKRFKKIHKHLTFLMVLVCHFLSRFEYFYMLEWMLKRWKRILLKWNVWQDKYIILIVFIAFWSVWSLSKRITEGFGDFERWCLWFS